MLLRALVLNNFLFFLQEIKYLHTKKESENAQHTTLSLKVLS